MSRVRNLRSILFLGVLLTLGACTSTSSVSTSLPSSAMAPPTPSTAATPLPDPGDVIELPSLPERGVAASWSRANNSEGVSLVTLGGRVIATVRGVGIFQAGRISPGLVILTDGDKYYWVLDVPAHELRRVSPARAHQLVEARGPAYLPSDAFAWSVQAPGGTQVLGQYWQQVSECQKPVAMLRPAPGLEASPVTGDRLAAAQPSYALGWTEAGEAVAAVASGPCDAGSATLHDGVYIFDSGKAQRLSVPLGSYVFQMWSS